MHRDSSPWSAPPGRRHDTGHTDEGDYYRRGGPGHEAGASGGHRSARGSNYGDWRGDPGREPDPYAGGGRWGADAGPSERRAESGDRFPSRGTDGPGGQGFGPQDVPGRYQGGYRGGYGQGDQGAGGFQGSPQRSSQSGYPGMYEDPYAGAHESGSYAGPYTGQHRGRSHPKAPNYGRHEDAGRQDSEDPGYSGQAWTDRDWQQDHGRPAQHTQHHDPDYHQWREEQMRRLDEDYRLWRQDRYQKFTEDFDAWRSRRQQQPASQSPAGQQQQQQGGAGQSSVGAGPGDARQVSGLPGAASETAADRTSQDRTSPASGDAGAGTVATGTTGSTGNTGTTGGHNAAVPGSGNDGGKGLGG